MTAKNRSSWGHEFHAIHTMCTSLIMIPSASVDYCYESKQMKFLATKSQYWARQLTAALNKNRIHRMHRFRNTLCFFWPLKWSEFEFLFCITVQTWEPRKLLIYLPYWPFLPFSCFSHNWWMILCFFDASPPGMPWFICLFSVSGV